MTFEEIGKRIEELKYHIQLLYAMKGDYTDKERIAAIDDGIHHLQRRLTEYQSARWTMSDVEWVG